MNNPLTKDNKNDDERIDTIERRVEHLENIINQDHQKSEIQIQKSEVQIQKSEVQIQKSELFIKKENKEVSRQIESQNQKIDKNEEDLSKQYQLIEAQNQKIDKFEEDLSKQNQLIEAQNQKISKYEEDLSKQNQLIEEQSQKIEELENKLNSITEEQEKRIQYLEKNTKKLKGKITVKDQPDHIIKGTIVITEKGCKLDGKRSKCCLNADPSAAIDKKLYENGQSIEKLKEELSFMKSAGTYYLHALLVDDQGHENQIVSKGVTTKGFSFNYSFTGHVETATLEPGTYKLEVWGAEGGTTDHYANTAGKGGYSVGLLTLKSTTKLHIHVGECPKNKNGGWNGGGPGGENDLNESPGGGGSTDISLYGEEEGSKDWNNKDHMYSRIIVAGAGGGSGHNDNPRLYGGFGGGLCGQNSGRGPADNEGTQTRAGTSTWNSKLQGFGVGGTRATFVSSGGGGGWYGGGASKAKGGGSGGSGYVYNESTACNYPSGCKLNDSYYLKNSKTLSGDQVFPSPLNSSTEKGHSGHGYAKISPQ